MAQLRWHLGTLSVIRTGDLQLRRHLGLSAILTCENPCSVLQHSHTTMAAALQHRVLKRGLQPGTGLNGVGLDAYSHDGNQCSQRRIAPWHPWGCVETGALEPKRRRCA